MTTPNRMNGEVRAAACLLVACVLALPAAAADLRVAEAAQNRDWPAVTTLLTQKADVTAAQPDGATALHWAAHWNHLETARRLVDAGANVNSANEYGITPLALACTNRSTEMVQMLLQAKANPNTASWSGETPLMTCVKTGDTAAVKVLLENRAEVNVRENLKGQTPLMWAAAARRPEIVKLLVQRGADVRARSKVIPEPDPYSVEAPTVFGASYPASVRFPKTSGGFSPLLFAAQQGDIESARILLEAGADVNEKTPEEESPLLIACASGHEKLALFLLEHGANPDDRNAYGMTPLHYSLNYGLLALNGAQPTAADRFGWERPNMPELMKTLLARGANPNTRIEKVRPYYDYLPIARVIGNDLPQLDVSGATPYLLATASGDVAAMRTLVESGADPKAVSSEGVNALMIAAGLGLEKGVLSEKAAIEAARIALALGADINAAKNDGRRAIHAAAFLGWTEMMRFLAENGADLEARDMYGETAMSIALGDPAGLIYRHLVGGRYDDRFRTPKEQKKSVETLLQLGAKPWTGKRRDRSAE